MKHARRAVLLAGAAGFFFAATAAWGKILPAEAERLKTELTPVGGERGANKDGSIPAWEGGLTTS